MPSVEHGYYVLTRYCESFKILQILLTSSTPIALPRIAFRKKQSALKSCTNMRIWKLFSRTELKWLLSISVFTHDLHSWKTMRCVYQVFCKNSWRMKNGFDILMILKEIQVPTAINCWSKTMTVVNIYYLIRGQESCNFVHNSWF